METQVIEGTFSEVQHKLNELHLNPKTHLRVIVTEVEDASTPEESLVAIAPRRNGLILLPARGLTTTEEVKEALYRADMEDALGDNWEEKLAQLQNADSDLCGTKPSAE